PRRAPAWAAGWPAPAAGRQARPRRPLQRRRAGRRRCPRRGMEVVYQGIRLTPAQIAAAARDEDVDVVGISILSGSHLQLVPEVVRLLRDEGVDAPVVVGGIVPAADVARLRAAGVVAIYTPKDFEISHLVEELAALAERHRADRAVTSR